MIKTKTWVAALGTVLVLSIGGLLAPKPQGTMAKVYQDGSCLHSVDLSQVTEPYDLPIKSGDKNNTLRVEAGRLRMVSANCPDQTCVHMGWSTGQPIICLPHKLMIEFTDAGTDALAG